MSQSVQRGRRIQPQDEAKLYCKRGVDKEGFSKQFINSEIGMCTLWPKPGLPNLLLWKAIMQIFTIKKLVQISCDL